MPSARAKTSRHSKHNVARLAPNPDTPPTVTSPCPPDGRPSILRRSSTVHPTVIHPCIDSRPSLRSTAFIRAIHALDNRPSSHTTIAIHAPDGHPSMLFEDAVRASAGHPSVRTESATQGEQPKAQPATRKSCSNNRRPRQEPTTWPRMRRPTSGGVAGYSQQPFAGMPERPHGNEIRSCKVKLC